MALFELSIYAVAGNANTRVPFRVLDDQDVTDQINYLLDGEDVVDLARVQDERSRHFRQLFGLPALQPYPKPRINQWFHPAGGARFGVFRGIMSAEDVAQINTYRGSSSAAVTLRMQCGSDDVLEGQMYLLPPKPVVGVSEADLFIVTLVDERYFWNWSYWDNPWPPGDSYSTTWTTFLPDNTVSVSANYYQPDPDSPFFVAGGIGVPPGILYDAAAQNTGRVVCQTIGGTTTNPTIYECAQVADAVQTTLDDRHIYGGDSKDADLTESDSWRRYHMPTTVRVVLPKWIEEAGLYPNAELTDNAGLSDSQYERSRRLMKHQPLADMTLPEFQAIEVTIGSLGTRWNTYGGGNGWTLTVYDTARYRYHSYGATALLRAAEREALTQQIAKDIGDNYAFWIDRTYRGIRDVSTSAGCDITWTYGEHATTRIRRDPREWQPRTYFHQFEHQQAAPVFAGVEVTGGSTSSPPGFQTIDVQRFAGAGSAGVTPAVHTDQGDDCEDAWLVNYVTDVDGTWTSPASTQYTNRTAAKVFPVGAKIFARRLCYQDQVVSGKTYKSYWAPITAPPAGPHAQGLVTLEAQRFGRGNKIVDSLTVGSYNTAATAEYATSEDTTAFETFADTGSGLTLTGPGATAYGQLTMGALTSYVTGTSVRLTLRGPIAWDGASSTGDVIWVAPDTHPWNQGLANGDTVDQSTTFFATYPESNLPLVVEGGYGSTSVFGPMVCGLLGIGDGTAVFEQISLLSGKVWFGQSATRGGLKFVHGLYVNGSLSVNLGTEVTGTLLVSNGGTGRSTLTSGQLLAGAGTSSMDSVGSTRVDSEEIEVKIASDRWVGFTKGSF